MQQGGNPAADKIQIKVEKQQAEAQRSLLELTEDFVVFIKIIGHQQQSNALIIH